MPSDKLQAVAWQDPYNRFDLYTREPAGAGLTPLTPLPAAQAALDAQAARIAELERERDEARTERDNEQAHRQRLAARIAELEAALAQAEADKGRLDFMQAHPWWELSYGTPDDGDETDELVWRVHELGGSRNDRVWTLKGEGPTAREALDAARAASGEGNRG